MRCLYAWKGADYVRAERLAAHGLEVGQALDGLEGGDGVVVPRERRVKLLLELELHVLVFGEVVGDRAGGAMEDVSVSPGPFTLQTCGVVLTLTSCLTQR